MPSLQGAPTMPTAGMHPTHRHTPLNEKPLEFNNMNKLSQTQPGAGPMELESLNDECSQSTDLDVARKMELNANADNKEKKFIAPPFGQCDLMFNGVMGMSSQSLMMMPGVMNVMDPSSMMGMQTMPQFSLLNHMAPMQTASASANASLVESVANANGVQSAVPSKETITCKSCVLLPPNPNAPAPTTRERPPGCRTVFVGGLPENITEDIIREIFERCGEIMTLRLSKKNFCHIRFQFEVSVESAIYLSGYRVRLNNLSDAPNCGRLHVDFAQARDDQYEWECKQRQLQREQRHRQQVERDRLRPSSPPSVAHYSEHEATSVSEKLKQDETFAKAVQVLITWLERGDCSKKNSNAFYSMIQCTNSHVRRLLNEKTAYEDELHKAKEAYRRQIGSLSIQCEY